MYHLLVKSWFSCILCHFIMDFNLYYANDDRSSYLHLSYYSYANIGVSHSLSQQTHMNRISQQRMSHRDIRLLLHRIFMFSMGSCFHDFHHR
jgi:hypothetical protein